MRSIYVDKKIPNMLAVKALRPLWPNVIWSPLSPTRVADLPEPSLPGSKWLRVRNIQCGVCNRSLHAPCSGLLQQRLERTEEGLDFNPDYAHYQQLI